MFTFVVAVILQNNTYDWVSYFSLLVVAAMNLAFIIFIVIKMGPDGWIKFNIFLSKFECLKRTTFVYNFIDS